jgi:hypothetical protein
MGSGEAGCSEGTGHAGAQLINNMLRPMHMNLIRLIYNNDAVRR